MVAIPTETVYGLAANGFNALAVAKIFEAKNRPSFNPLILHIGNKATLDNLVAEVPEKAQQLIDAFWPGPLTLVLPKANQVPDIVTAGKATVAVRMPNHELTLSLLNSLDFPLAAPSANPSGYISPTKPEHVAEQLGDKVPYILDGGPCSVGLESTIVKIDGDRAILLRPGGLERERIEALIGPVELPQGNSIEAPGMMSSHYAPKKPVYFGTLATLLQEHAGETVGVLSFNKAVEGIPGEHQRILSPTGNLQEAATNVFQYLRELDSLPVDVVLAEQLPEKGLGIAINDRLTRAAVKP